MYNIKMDSRRVKKGDTFVAIKGHTVDGHDYINQAIKNGATKIIASTGNYEVETIIVEDPEKYIIDYIINEYKKYTDEMNIVGITGTNGKTTTAYLTYQILKQLNQKVSYIGTIGYYNDELVKELNNTSPHIIEMYELIIDSYQKGIKNIIMEVSSHALELKRVEGLNFKVGAFTNLTQDHLDFHGSLENYLEAKKLITKKSNKMIVNIDDPKGKEFITDNTITFGFENSDYQVLEYENTMSGTKIKYYHQNQEKILNTKLRGKFNVYNSMMAFIISNEFASLEEVTESFENIEAPKGRSQIIKVKNGEAVIDYAHTPDAVDKIISAFNEIKTGRIITIVGCGGDRDPKKRPIMGKIASEKSDYVIYTSDNPRTEDPKSILEQVVSGATKDNYEAIIDRKEAIKKALDMIEEGDIVLLLGKGHEDYQIIGHDKIHLDDTEEVKKYTDNNK